MGASVRRLLTFPCEGEALVGTLDQAAGATGLLIVSGGNEVRAGAHRGMALLAAGLAASGVPVFRFDRRGVGDSSGENGGYLSSAPDIAAAVAMFRVEAPQITHVVGFGNCDAATALALFGRAAGVDRLVLANPWVVERAADDLPPAAAIRARYAERLRDPRQWWRLLRGGVNVGKILKGLRAVVRKQTEHPLARRFAETLGGQDATVILATRDATAIAYADAARAVGLALPTTHIDTASHSFAHSGDAAALEMAIRATLGTEEECLTQRRKAAKK